MDNTNEYFASINEVSKRLDIPAHTLRYWEKQFPVAIRPTTGAGGRRYYRTETVARLVVIKDLLYTHGMTIAGVKKLLRDGKLPASASEITTPDVTQKATNFSSTSSIDDIQINSVIEMLKNARDILH